MDQVTLARASVKDSCKKVLKDFEHDCSGFVRAVADDLLLFVPLAPGQADDQVEFMRLIASAPRLFFAVGDGQSAESDAVDLARSGSFVIAGMTSEELNENPTRAKKKTGHGHVALVTGGWGPTGWPLGYWGQYGGKPGYGRSLSECFRAADRPRIHYFAYLRS
jgi:hypothetical protein